MVTIVDLYEGNNANLGTLRGQGVEGFILKADQGTYHTDSKFAARWEYCRKQFVDRGAYHFADDRHDPKASAEHFHLAVVKAGGWKRGDVYALDYEITRLGTPAKRQAWASKFIAYMKEVEESVPGLLYSSEFFYLHTLGLPGRFRGTWPWVAAYRSNPAPHVDNWYGWQYSDHYHGAYDVSRFQHPLRDLAPKG